jgi:two-component system cell cycle sensor histidine kinase/response regulator CckA
MTDSIQDTDGFFRFVLANIDDLVAVIDLQGRRIYNSPSYEQIFGDVQRLQGTDSFDEIHPEDREGIQSVFQETVRTGKGHRAEYRFLLPDGTIRYIESHGNLIRDAEGKPEKVVVISRDVTERKLGEQALRESEQLFRSFFEHSSDIIVITDEKYGILQASPSIQRVLGYTPEEVLDKSFVAFLHPEDVPRVVHTFELATRQPGVVQSAEHRLQHKLNAWRMFESMTKTATDERGRQTLIINARDITERNRAEEFLRETNYTLQSLIRTSPLAIVATDLDGRVRMWNKAAERIFGWTESDVLGDLPLISPHDSTDSRMSAVERRKREDSEQGLELLVTRKDGGSVDVSLWRTPLRDANGVVIGSMAIYADITKRKRAEEEHARLMYAVEQAAESIVITDRKGTIVYVNPAFEKVTGYTREETLGKNPRLLKSGAQTEDFYRQMWSTLEQGDVWSGRITNKRKDGHLYEEEMVISPVRDHSGNIINYVAVKRDVTHELEMERQLRQSQKMESLGQLAGGIAHDFNNVLGVVDGSLTILKSRVPDREAQRYIDMAEGAVNRGSDVAKRLLTFSREEQAQLAPVSLGEIVEELTEVLESTIEKTVVVSSEIPRDLPYVMGDQGQLYQGLLNLCINARDAIMDPRTGATTGTITISVTIVEGSTLLDRIRDASPDPYVRLSVSDTGCGMTEEVKQRIFDPFFTTKPKGKGTGLGLAVVYGIVKSHKGFVEVESAPGSGTSFHIYLPALSSRPEVKQEAKDQPLQAGSETILVVEDDASLQALLSELLRMNGYTILAAGDGEQALEIYRAHHGEIGAVIADLGLPKMSGEELLKQIVALTVPARVIIASGYLEPTQKSRLHMAGARAFVQKPYKGANILRTLRGVLDQTS